MEQKTPAGTTVLIDARLIVPRERHPRITAAWDALPVGGALRLVVDHDPKPLYYEFEAESAGTFRWEYRERGPETWVVEVTRTAPAAEPTLEMTVQEVASRWPQAAGVLHARGLDLCCGGVHPVAMAAQAHGVDAQALLAELKEAARATPKPHVCRCGGHKEESASARPEVIKLDVSRLEPPEPMVRILSALPALEEGQVLEVEHHREPVPLYPRLEAAGFSHEIEKLAEGRYRLRIRRAV